VQPPRIQPGLASCAMGPVGTIDRLEIDANRLRFSARAAGPTDGRPIILLHGFPQTSWCWRAQLGALGAAGYRAFAPDQRGYSVAARPAHIADYSMANLLGDLLALADALGWDTFDLVGHDWGGMVAWQAGTRYPERVRSLTVVSTPHPLALQHAQLGGDPDQVGRAQWMDRYLEHDAAEHLLLGPLGTGDGLFTLLTDGGLGAEDAEAYVTVMREEGALTGALNWYRAMDRSDLFELVPVEVPTLYVWSSHDAALGRVAAEATAECVSGPYQFAVLDGVSHWVPETAAQPLTELLLAHLART
jgi:pimeloyl-ACP methyl ester carboxylesterase